MTEPAALARYYDWLSRYQGLVGRMRGDVRCGAFTVHRLLTGAGGEDGLHQRLLTALGSTPVRHAIDAGCGVGGTMFFLQERLGGRYEGLTVSRVQQARAAREARRRGVASVCRFHLRSYDDDLHDLAPEGTDLVVAIESLAHAPDPARTIGRLARVLRRGGRLAIAEDIPAQSLADDDPDFTDFTRDWRCPAIARHSVLTAALVASGLTLEKDEDLTPLVDQREPARLDQLVRFNRACRRVPAPTPARVVLDGLHGGLMLERLYRRGLMGYRLLIAHRHGGQ
jgi:SAM-dependent methyltransferase